MFCSHKIELHARAQDLSTALIPRELLAEHTQARQILEQAETQAQALIHQAETQAQALIHQAENQCEKILERASNEFWQRANSQLQRWESDRQAMFDQLETAASSVINAAIRSLLEETVPAQRLTVLLNKLLTAQLPTVEANLRCHPLDREHVEHWLSRHCDVPWALRVEDGVAAGSLILETEDGGFHINWTDAVNNLVVIPPKSRNK